MSIDVHAHCVPADLLEVLAKDGRDFDIELTELMMMHSGSTVGVGVDATGERLVLADESGILEVFGCRP